ncbi:Tumor necrosis factor receptor superfamily member 10B, partial [Phoenicopterus ruber ruber]
VQDSDRYCRKCPAEHCKEQNGSSKCLPCKEDEYIEYPNDFPKCLGCRKVELSPCRAVSDTQCACKNGTFCSPDHPCEMCQKCRPRCPKDEVELAPCTPHSDRQCGPPTGTFSGPSSEHRVWGTPGALAPAKLCLGVGWVGRGTCLGEEGSQHCCHLPGDGRDLSGKSCSVVVSCWDGLHGAAADEVPEGEPGDAGQRPQREVLPGSAAPQGVGTLSFQVMVPRTLYPSVKPRRNLVPVQGKDPTILLRLSFDIFAQEVPHKDWKRFGRALELLENDIALAEMNDKYSLEPFFQMLNTWQNRQGMNASVNTLLETLHQINLGGIAEDISSKLVQQGSFQYEVS